MYLLFAIRSDTNTDSEYILVGKDPLTNVLMLDVGYRLQTFTVGLQTAAFAFLLADQDKTQRIVNQLVGKIDFFQDYYFFLLNSIIALLDFF